MLEKQRTQEKGQRPHKSCRHRGGYRVHRGAGVDDLCAGIAGEVAPLPTYLHMHGGSCLDIVLLLSAISSTADLPPRAHPVLAYRHTECASSQRITCSRCWRCVRSRAAGTESLLKCPISCAWVMHIPLSSHVACSWRQRRDKLSREVLEMGVEVH